MLKLSESSDITWYGHGSLKINFDNKIIFIDPYNIDEGSADIILVTHSHNRHFSKDDINKIKKTNTIFAVPYDSADLIEGGKIVVKPDVKFNLYGVTIETTPAYNLSAKPYHPKSKNWVGYILNLNGTRIYHSGDTDDIPEMKKLKVDIAFLPISGRSVMTAKKAARVANKFKPAIAVPIHWDSSAKSIQDAAIFKKNFDGETRILKPEI